MRSSWLLPPLLTLATLPAEVLHVGGAPIGVEITAGAVDVGQPALLRWMTRAAEAVTAYYGHFPLQTSHVRVHPVAGESRCF